MDSSLRLWDLASGEKVGSIEVGPVDIWTVAFSPDDKFIISGSHSGKIALYGVESAKQEQTLDTRGKFTLSIAYVSRELIYQDILAVSSLLYHAALINDKIQHHSEIIASYSLYYWSAVSSQRKSCC